jgi:SAM-dependent methyltransferase
MSERDFLKGIEEYYTTKILQNGPNHKAVDWKDAASQELRFSVLTKGLEQKKDATFSVLDYGCGYGALFPFLKEKFRSLSFTGFDISQEMIREASNIHAADSDVDFTSTRESLGTYDYVMASGIFNVRLDVPDGVWFEHVRATLSWMYSHCSKGISFNVLTSYSDVEHTREYLYYADPRVLFDYCKKNFSRYVLLDHSYPLYEFTIHVKREHQ